MNQINKKMNGGAVFASLLIGTVFFLLVWCVVIAGFSNNESLDRPDSAIDVIYVTGEISSSGESYDHNWTINYINELMNENSNKGILLYIDSPGGGVYESDELYTTLKQYKKVTKRPVYAYMASQCCSGGLYTAMAADKIFANRMCMTGSIGVILSMVDTTELQNLIGVKTVNITSGKNKAMGSTTLTAEQKEILQSIIDESYDIFVSVIAENRNLSVEAVKKMADGRVYSPKQAKELGLIDEIASFDETMAAFKKEKKLSDCEYYSKEQPETFLSKLLYGKKQIGSIDSQFDKIEKYIDKKSGVKLMYRMP